MAGLWKGLTLLVLVLCLVSSSFARTRPSDVEAVKGFLRAWHATSGLLKVWSLTKDEYSELRSINKLESLRQRISIPSSTRLLPHRVLLQSTAPPPVVATPPARPPVATPPPPQAAKAVKSARIYVMWIGIGAFILVIIAIATCCFCRIYGQNKIRRAQRMPPLPRYH